LSAGKTGAFCLPILQITWESLKDLQTGGSKKKEEGGGTSHHQPWAMSFFDRGPALAVTPDGKSFPSF
jgi:ATP-dependent RNA helicase DDX1